jgi:hypothetical protein
MVAASKKALLCAAVAGTLSTSAAFAPPTAGSIGLAAPKIHAAAPSSRRAGRRAVADTKMDMGLVSAAAGVPLMYALMSANEYVTHRYYQHNEVGCARSGGLCRFRDSDADAERAWKKTERLTRA